MPTSRFSLIDTLPKLLLAAAVASPFGARADDLGDVELLMRTGQKAAAIQRIDRLLAARPNDPQLLFVKGVVLADTGRKADAIALYERLNTDYPELAEPYNNLAVLYAGDGDYGRARAALEQAVRVNPTYATGHENLGDMYAALAAQSYAQALKLEPGNATVPPKLALVRDLYKRGGSAIAPPSRASAPR